MAGPPPTNLPTERNAWTAFALKVPADLRAALVLFMTVRVPWLFITGSVAGFWPLQHGALGMPSTVGPAWAQNWLRWDSGWYVEIIRNGYTASHCGEPRGICQQASISFMPAFPMSVRGLMQLGLSLPVASWVLNAVCLVLAIWGLRRLATLTLGGDDAPSRATWALLAFPTTVFFSAGYAEAMFAAASIWAMVFVTRGNALPAALALAIGSLCRPHGIILAACVVFVSLLRRRLELAAIVMLVTSLVFGGYLLWQYREFGDPVAFLHARRAWGVGERPLALLRAYWNRTTNGEIALTGGQDFCAAATIAAAALWSLWHRRFEYALYCLLLVGLPLAQGQFWGMSRAALGVFPIFLMLASVAPRLRQPLAYFGLSLATLNAVLFITGVFVA